MQNLRRKLPPLSSLLPFEATARLGSVTKAALELGLTQAAVSKQIRLLEENLEATLFERRNRAVHLTDDGRAFGVLVSEALGTIGAAANDLRDRHETGDIVFRSQLCEGLYWLMPRLSGFYQRHPDVSVRVSVSTDPITEATEPFDLALQTAGRDSGSAEIVFKTSDAVFPVCSPKYLGRRKLPLPLSRLPKLHLLHHRVQPQDWQDWNNWAANFDVTGEIGERGTVYDSYPMMMQAVLEGHGIALGWRRTVEDFLASGKLVRPFDDQFSLPDALIVYRPANRRVRTGAKLLLDWLKSELA